MDQVSLPTKSPCMELFTFSSAAWAGGVAAAQVLLRLAFGPRGTMSRGYRGCFGY